MKQTRRRKPRAERFWPNVNKEAAGGCWLWTGRSNPGGYGLFSRSPHDPPGSLAHRVAWELIYGAPPDGQLNHICQQSLCCNPEHLYVGTQSQNMFQRWQSRAGMARPDYQPRQSGRPALSLPEKAESLHERFHAGVLRGEADECWLWTRATDDKGYGKLGFGVGVVLKVHRLAYEMHYGFDPGDYFVCHRCDNPTCCNPRHLFLGDCMANNRDRHAKGRDNYSSRSLENVPRGQAHWAVTLPDEKLAEMRARRVDGESRKKLAAEYGIAYSTAGTLLNGRSRSHPK